MHCPVVVCAINCWHEIFALEVGSHSQAYCLCGKVVSGNGILAYPAGLLFDIGFSLLDPHTACYTRTKAYFKDREGVRK
jgi:hypothetical protein